MHRVSEELCSSCCVWKRHNHRERTEAMQIDNSPSITTIRGKRSADAVPIAAVPPEHVTRISVRRAARPVGRVSRQPGVRLRGSHRLRTVPGLADVNPAEAGPGAALAVKVAAVAPLAGAEPVSVVDAAGAVGAVDRVPPAGALPASARGTVGSGRGPCKHMMRLSWPQGLETYSVLPHFQVSELQHWKSVPRHVAPLLEGPQMPSFALSGSMTEGGFYVNHSSLQGFSE